MLERKIPLGAVQGRIDHLSVDLARQRLFVAELGNGSLGVVDLQQDKLLHRNPPASTAALALDDRGWLVCA
jgi:hypothetical protein